MPKRRLKTLRHNRGNAESSGISLNFQCAAFSCKKQAFKRQTQKAAETPPFFHILSFIKVTAFIKNPLLHTIQAPRLPIRIQFLIYLKRILLH